jgi:hypothetical protein
MQATKRDRDESEHAEHAQEYLSPNKRVRTDAQPVSPMEINTVESLQHAPPHSQVPYPGPLAMQDAMPDSVHMPMYISHALQVAALQWEALPRRQTRRSGSSEMHLSEDKLSGQ